ncbi:MAG TPA: 50S ribosomal protein L6 [Rhodospirillales bacterium]|nr:50S ribosomal protein L6 [Rhodospirillales bacterium]
MSRIGKHPVPVPGGVEVALEGQQVRVKGKLGELSQTLPPEVEVRLEDGRVVVRPRDDSRRARAMWGLSRSLVANMVDGVAKGFEKRLELSGVGYRAVAEGKILTLQLGYSHDIKYAVPEGITITTPSATSIVVAGADKQRVGQVAAEIRSFRKPEPYKGKGIRYADEVILRKEGKKK